MRVLLPAMFDVPPSLDFSQHKWCTFCGNRKPFSDFHVDQYSDDGYRSTCKQCRAKENDDERMAGLDPRLQALEEEALSVVETLHKGGSYVPHTSELLESIMRPFGGADGFGRTLFATFYACDAGSARRVKILELVVSLVKANSLDGGEVLEAMEESDLRRIMAASIRDYQKKLALSPDSIPTIEAVAEQRETA